MERPARNQKSVDCFVTVNNLQNKEAISSSAFIQYTTERHLVHTAASNWQFLFRRLFSNSDTVNMFIEIQDSNKRPALSFQGFESWIWHQRYGGKWCWFFPQWNI